jgi:hypothetical protein
MLVKRFMDKVPLHEESAAHPGTGGAGYRCALLGFRPAFFDPSTFAIHLSRFADGRLAPVHLLDGLPDEVVVDRSASGRAVAAKACLIPGFERDGFFYTRESTARACADW